MKSNTFSGTASVGICLLDYAYLVQRLCFSFFFLIWEEGISGRLRRFRDIGLKKKGGKGEPLDYF